MAEPRAAGVKATPTVQLAPAATLAPHVSLATANGPGFRIGYRDFSDLKTEHGIDAFEGVVAWVHWVLQLETTDSPGRDTFKYFYRFFAGAQAVYPERLGCFVRRLGNTYQLDRQTYGLVEAMETFNALPPELRTGGNAFIRFAEVKGLAEEVGAELDQFLLSEKVVVPSEIALDIIPEEE